MGWIVTFGACGCAACSTRHAATIFGGGSLTCGGAGELCVVSSGSGRACGDRSEDAYERDGDRAREAADGA
jgi:hypothetical protein